MANILIISALQVFPTRSGGHQRTALIAGGLAQAGHSVQIYSLIGRKKDMLRGIGTTNTEIMPGLSETVKRPRLLWLRAMMAYRLGVPPVWASDYLRKYDPQLNRLVNKSHVVIFDFPYTFATICKNEQMQMLISHNVESELFRDSGERLAKQVEQLEKRAISGVQLVACASIAELGAFSDLSTHAELVIVPNVVNPQRFMSQSSDIRLNVRERLGISDRSLVLFFPASRYGPNNDGFDFIRNFADRHNNLLTALDITILVVGSVARAPLQLGPVIATGPVPEIEPYFAASDWGFNPIFQGSGTSVKVAEIIASGLPLLTTRIGARGFSLNEQASCVFFDRENLETVLPNLPKHPIRIATMTSAAKEANRQFFDANSAITPLLAAISRHI